MSSEARRLRERSRSDPRSVANEASTLRRLLGSSDYETRRHAAEAVRKAAHAHPRPLVECVPELADVAASGETPSIRRTACYALGYLGRVAAGARDALAAPQSDATAPEVRRAAAKARNSLARGEESDGSEPPEETAVFDGEESTVTEETAVFDASGGTDDASSGDAGGPNFCSNCGTDLRSAADPNFCSNCGMRL